MPGPKYEEIEHTADRALRVRGESFEELLANAAEGMFSLIGAARFDPEECEVIEIFIADGSPEERLYQWLCDLLRAFNLQRFFPAEISLESTAAGLVGRARGGRFDPACHEFRSEIKGVTLHGLAVTVIDRRFEADVIFDV